MLPKCAPYSEGKSFLFWCLMEEWNTRLQNRDGEFSYELEVYPVTKSEKNPRFSEERSEENHADFFFIGTMKSVMKWKHHVTNSEKTWDSLEGQKKVMPIFL